MNMKRINVLVLALALLSLCACTKKSETVSLNGSTSMEKVINVLSESYMGTHAGLSITYDPTGSSSGITAVAEGRTDIGLSSRALKDSELALGLEGTVLGLDGIALVVHPDNAVKNLTLAQVEAIYTGAITNWKDVGGTDATIVVIGREAGSGTRDGFESITNTKDACHYRQELTSTGDVIATVAQNPQAIGYASLASVSSLVTALSIAGVVPSEETIRAGSYLLSRPFVLVTKKSAPLSGAALDFFNYITSSDADALKSKAGVIVPARA